MTFDDNASIDAERTLGAHLAEANGLGFWRARSETTPSAVQRSFLSIDLAVPTIGKVEDAFIFDSSQGETIAMRPDAFLARQVASEVASHPRVTRMS